MPRLVSHYTNKAQTYSVQGIPINIAHSMANSKLMETDISKVVLYSDDGQELEVFYPIHVRLENDNGSD